MANKKKESCTCNPKQKGCSHFLSGRCRIMPAGNNKCVMRMDSYHYACCPLLNSNQGKALLNEFNKEREDAKHGRI
jgi:hypothetical protein